MITVILIRDPELEILFKLVDSQVQSYKNWILSAVESGEIEYAQKLTRECREHQELFAKLNHERRARGLGEWAEKKIEE